MSNKSSSRARDRRGRVTVVLTIAELSERLPLGPHRLAEVSSPTPSGSASSCASAAAGG